MRQCAGHSSHIRDVAGHSVKSLPAAFGLECFHFGFLFAAERHKDSSSSEPFQFDGLWLVVTGVRLRMAQSEKIQEHLGGGKVHCDVFFSQIQSTAAWNHARACPEACFTACAGWHFDPAIHAATIRFNHATKSFILVPGNADPAQPLNVSPASNKACSKAVGERFVSTDLSANAREAGAEAAAVTSGFLAYAIDFEVRRLADAWLS